MNGFLIGMLSGLILPFRSFVTARKRSLRKLCFHKCLSVQGEGGLGGLCPGGSLYKGGFCLGSFLGGLCPGGSLSRQGVSVQGDLDQAGGSLPRGGSLSRRVSVRETPKYGNERAVRILLECILVVYYLFQ